MHRRAHHLHQGWGHELRDGARGGFILALAAGDEGVGEGAGEEERAAHGERIARGEEPVGREWNDEPGAGAGGGAPNILAKAASLAMPPSMLAPVVAVNLPAALEFAEACARSPTTSLRLAAAYVPAYTPATIQSAG